MSVRALAPNNVKKRGMEALTRELGVAGMVQFMQQFSTGCGDYSKDRHRIIDQFSVDDVLGGMKKDVKRG